MLKQNRYATAIAMVKGLGVDTASLKNLYDNILKTRGFKSAVMIVLSDRTLQVKAGQAASLEPLKGLPISDLFAQGGATQRRKRMGFHLWRT